MTDLDTRACPRGHRCESCGAEAAGLAVHALTTGAGVLCLTLCPRCAASTTPPPLQAETRVRLVEQHRRHRGGVR